MTGRHRISPPPQPLRALFASMLACGLLHSLPAAAQLAPDATPRSDAHAPAAPTPPPAPITPPSILGDAVVPDYPAEALAEKKTARVVLIFDIGVDGTVSNATVASVPQPGFDESALAAVARLRFNPARQGEQPIPVRIQFAFNFAPPVEAVTTHAPTEQPVNFTGRVRERGTRRKLFGIEVAIPALELTTITDAQGRFEFHGIPAGNQEVVIAASGYQRFSATELIEEGKKLEVAYLLRSLMTNPYEATVQGEAERKEISKTSISIEEVNRLPGTGGDALKVIEDLPGVARSSPAGGGLLIIRGSDPFDSLVFLDGLEIPLLYHFGALSSTVNPDLLSGIDYIPGNFSSAYGDMVGGLVSVKSRGLRDEFHGYANLNLLESSILLEGPVPGIPGLQFSLSGRRSYIDVILNAVFSGGDIGLTSAPRYYDAQVRLDYRPPGTNHSLQFIGLTSDDAISLLFKRPLDSDPGVSGTVGAETGFSQFRLKDVWHSGAWTIDTVAMYEHFLLKFGVGTTNLSIVSNNLELRSVIDYQLSPALVLSGGFDSHNVHANTSASIQASGLAREGDPNQVNPPRPGDPPITVSATPFNRYSPAIFAEVRWHPIESILITPGVRFDSYIYTAQDHPARTISPRLTARWNITDELAVKGGVGLYTEGARNGDPSQAFGNPNILPEQALQVTAGGEWRPLPGLFISIEGFYKKLTSLVVASPTSNISLDNNGIGRIYGVELLVRKELTDNLFGWIAYTLSRSQRIDQPGEQWRPFDLDQPSNLTIVASYKLPFGFQFGGRFRLISGNPDTPVIGARYFASTDTYSPIYGTTNSSRLPLFHQLDLRVDKLWTFDQWTLDLYIDVLNVYNHRSIEGTQYSYDYSQSSYIQGLPVLPSLGLKGSF